MQGAHRAGSQLTPPRSSPILGRFRVLDLPAFARFAAEFLWVVVQLPQWIPRHRAEGPSAFRASPGGQHARPPRFGL